MGFALESAQAYDDNGPYKNPSDHPYEGREELSEQYCKECGDPLDIYEIDEGICEWCHALESEGDDE